MSYIRGKYPMVHQGENCPGVNCPTICIHTIFHKFTSQETWYRRFCRKLNSGHRIWQNATNRWQVIKQNVTNRWQVIKRWSRMVVTFLFCLLITCNHARADMHRSCTAAVSVILLLRILHVFAAVCRRQRCNASCNQIANHQKRSNAASKTIPAKCVVHLTVTDSWSPEPRPERRSTGVLPTKRWPHARRTFRIRGITRGTIFPDGSLLRVRR